MTDGQQKRGAELEEVRQMLVDCNELFRNMNDLSIINEGTQYTVQVADARTTQAEAARSELKALLKTLEKAKQEAQRPAEVPSREQHSRHLESLEQKQYSDVKVIRKLQSELDQKLQAVQVAKDEIAFWEAKDPVGEWEVDKVPLRSQIWKSLGFELRRGKDGGPDKLIIRTEGGDLRLRPVSQNLSAADTNELWEINLS